MNGQVCNCESVAFEAKRLKDAVAYLANKARLHHLLRLSEREGAANSRQQAGQDLHFHPYIDYLAVYTFYSTVFASKGEFE